MKILKFIVVIILTLIGGLSLYFILRSSERNSSLWYTFLVPAFFITTFFIKRKATWILAIIVALWGIVDVFYFGSYSATVPAMQFTQLITVNTCPYWLQRTLNVFSTLFYPATLIVLLLPAIRKKYFHHAS